jgi:glycosyltransferase involved in cell wall biosynthesis
MAKKISVILCTYNRCHSLAKALDSVAVSKLPDSIDWEVLVVDNNSSDQTREVVERFCRRHSDRFRYLFEPQQGKSHALNAGIRESRGEILAFIDDDVTVEPMWLQNLTAPLQDREEVAGSGGRILPAHAFSAPRWLALSGPYAMGGILYAHFDLGDEAKELEQPPYGTNMAIRKKMFDKYGYFRTDMGPCPGSEIRNEDTEFCRRLLAGKERLRYAPSAIVYHEVPLNRISKKFFLKWWFDYGRALIRETEKSHEVSDIWKIIPRIVPMTFGWMRALNPQLRFYRKCWVWVVAGEGVEIYRQARSSDSLETKNTDSKQRVQ